MKYFTLSILLLISGPTMAQRCEIISMQHIGGNIVDQVFPYQGIIPHPDGKFSIIVSHNSTTGSLRTDCPGDVYLTYNSTFTTMNQYCAPGGSDPGFYPHYVYPQPNGDTILVGAFYTHDIGIERRDAAGNVLWFKIYGGTASDGIASVAQASDGGFFIAVGTNSTDGDVGMHYGSVFTADTWVLRVDNDGNMLWGKVLGGSNTDLARDIKAAADGGCYIFGVTGSTDYDATGNHGVSDLHIVKLDSLGNKDWHKCLGGSDDDGCGYDMGIKAIPDHSGGFYVINRTSSHDGDVQHRMPDDVDFWLLHIDAAANILWETTFGGPQGQYPSSLCQAADGSLWMAGYFFGGTPIGGMIDAKYGNTDSWIVHADSLGNFINQRVLGGNSPDEAVALHPLPNGTVVVAGNYYYGNADSSRSPGFPENSEGDQDIYIAHLGPQTVGISEKEIAFATWELYPNPASRQLNVGVKDKNALTFSLVIIDVQGKEIFKDRISQRLSIDTKTWPAGNYWVKLQDEKGRYSIKNIVITH
jgi:hypothetical protein